MKIKADWIDSLHKLKVRETDAIFSKCPEKVFGEGLELGAGNGYQSRLISKYVMNLVSSDYSAKRMNMFSVEGIEHAVCDAERVGDIFVKGQFDFIFSSNMLEHLSHPEKALRGMNRVLKNEGIMIHVMSNSFWKLSQIVMFYPNLFVEIIERVLTPYRLLNAIKKRFKKNLSF